MTSQKPLPNTELSTALGHIVRLCSNLDGLISVLISYLIGPDREIGQIVTSGLSFNSLSSLLNALFRYRVHDRRAVAELERLLKRAELCHRRRNELIHATWSAHDESDVFLRLKNSKRSHGLRKDRETISLVHLEAAIERTDQVISDFVSFLLHHVGQFPPTHVRRRLVSNKTRS